MNPARRRQVQFRCAGLGDQAPQPFLLNMGRAAWRDLITFHRTGIKPGHGSPTQEDDDGGSQGGSSAREGAPSHHSEEIS